MCKMAEDPDVGMKKPHHHTMPTQWKWLQSGWVGEDLRSLSCVCSPRMQRFDFDVRFR